MSDNTDLDLGLGLDEGDDDSTIAQEQSYPASQVNAMMEQMNLDFQTRTYAVRVAVDLGASNVDEAITNAAKIEQYIVNGKSD